TDDDAPAALATVLDEGTEGAVDLLRGESPSLLTSGHLDRGVEHRSVVEARVAETVLCQRVSVRTQRGLQEGGPGLAAPHVEVEPWLRVLLGLDRPVGTRRFHSHLAPTGALHVWGERYPVRTAEAGVHPRRCSRTLLRLRRRPPCGGASGSRRCAQRSRT